MDCETGTALKKWLGNKSNCACNLSLIMVFLKPSLGIVKHSKGRFQKLVEGLKDFWRVLKMEIIVKKIIIEVIIRKDPILGNYHKWEFWQNFIGTRKQVRCTFWYLKSFIQWSSCLAVHLPSWCKKHGLKHFCNLFKLKHTVRIFYSCIIWFAVQKSFSN